MTTNTETCWNCHESTDCDWVEVITNGDQSCGTYWVCEDCMYDVDTERIAEERW